MDIVFRLDQSVNLTGGFQVIIPNTAYITVHMGVEFSDLDRPIFTVNHDLYVLAHHFFSSFLSVLIFNGRHDQYLTKHSATATVHKLIRFH